MQKAQEQLWGNNGQKQWTKKKAPGKGGASAKSAGSDSGGAADGFFKGSSGVTHGRAEWSIAGESGRGPLWPSSWSSTATAASSGSRHGSRRNATTASGGGVGSAGREDNDNVVDAADFPAELEALCGPFVDWLRSSYASRARERAPIVCTMPPHQGLGDQMKGVLRCWASALVTQRPLVFSHGKSRSSWVWKDDAMVAPLKFMASRKLVDFNPKNPPATGSSGTSPAGGGGAAVVEIEQDFTGSKPLNLFPCSARGSAIVGGVRPFHGIEPALANVRRSAAAADVGAGGDPSNGRKLHECKVMLREAEAVVAALQASSSSSFSSSSVKTPAGARVDRTPFCLVRSLLEPQPLLRRTVEVLLGKGAFPPTAAAAAAARKGLAKAAVGPQTMRLPSPLPPIVGLHLRMQENIASPHDIDWEVHCVGLIAGQLVRRRQQQQQQRPHQLKQQPPHTRPHSRRRRRNRRRLFASTAERDNVAARVGGGAPSEHNLAIEIVVNASRKPRRQALSLKKEAEEEERGRPDAFSLSLERHSARQRQQEEQQREHQEAGSATEGLRTGRGQRRGSKWQRRKRKRRRLENTGESGRGGGDRRGLLAAGGEPWWKTHPQRQQQPKQQQGQQQGQQQQQQQQQQRPHQPAGKAGTAGAGHGVGGRRSGGDPGSSDGTGVASSSSSLLLPPPPPPPPSGLLNTLLSTTTQPWEGAAQEAPSPPSPPPPPPPTFSSFSLSSPARPPSFAPQPSAGVPSVVFAVATDSPQQLEAITTRILRTAAVCHNDSSSSAARAAPAASATASASPRCVFVTMDSVGTMGHVSNHETKGETSVSQRMWADWFMLSEAETCVYSRSGFPRFACLGSSHRAATDTNVFEKDICGTHREGALSPPPLEAGCDVPSQTLAERQCTLLGDPSPLLVPRHG